MVCERNWLIKSLRVEKTDSDLFGTTKMTQILEDYKKNIYGY